MEKIKKFGRFICESKTHDCFELFGNELFGDEFNKDEPNTEVQKDYSNIIKKFTEYDFGENLDSSMIEAIKNLKSCISVYPEVLLNEGTSLYRGMDIKTSTEIYKTIENIVINSDISLFDKSKISKGDNMYLGETDTIMKLGELSLKQTYMIESWSSNFDRSKSFSLSQTTIRSNEHIRRVIFEDLRELLLDGGDLVSSIKEIKENAGCPLIYKTISTKETNLFKSEYFNKLSKFKEDEVLSIGQHTIECEIYCSYFVAVLFKLCNFLIENEVDKQDNYDILYDEEFMKLYNTLKLNRYSNNK